MCVYPLSCSLIALIFRATFCIETSSFLVLLVFCVVFLSFFLFQPNHVINLSLFYPPNYIFLKASQHQEGHSSFSLQKEELHPAIDKLLPPPCLGALCRLFLCVFQLRSTAVIHLTDAMVYV